jgi:metal-responsive CopG/Arc/MetJ family transcriptional regulator
MATTVHIPPDILRDLDRRAKKLKTSRNRLIVDAVKKLLAEPPMRGAVPEWRALIHEMNKDPNFREGLNDLDEVMKKNRVSSKPPIKF